jgi:hypothetical protein
VCQTAVRNTFIIPTIYTRDIGDKTVPINSFFPFLFCSILNKKNYGRCFLPSPTYH